MTRVHRFYGGTFQSVLDLPIKQFWLLSKNVDRLAAEEDARLMDALTSAQSGETATKFMTRRREIMGQVIVYDEGKIALVKAQTERDRAGLQRLKGMRKAV